MGYPGYCGGKQQVCGYDSAEEREVLLHKTGTITTTTPVPVSCPSGCSCYTLEDGKQQGLGLCGNKMTLCGYSPNTAAEILPRDTGDRHHDNPGAGLLPLVLLLLHP